jgi:hypothetical protein
MEPPPFISLNASPPLEPELMFNMVSPFFQQPQLVTKMIPREPFWGKGTRQSRVDWLRREAHLLLVLTGLQQTQYLLPLHNVVIVRDPLHYNSFCDPRHSDTYLSSLLDYGSNPSDVKTLEHEWNGQDWQRKLNLLVQCARAVQELHSGGFPSIVHCNLSPDKFVVLPKDQVLLRGLEYAGICYCNSNEATVYDRLRQPRNAACCSPEQLCIYETVRYLGEDIWGLGGILVYMVEGKYLRTKSRNDEIKPDLQSVPSIFRKEYIQMVNGCLETYPGQRWPLQRLVRTLETMESAWNAFDTYFPDNKYLMPALRSIILAFLD